MARPPTPSPRVSEPKASAAWLRSQTRRERTSVTAAEDTHTAQALGSRLAELRVDRNERLPSEAVPLLP